MYICQQKASMAAEAPFGAHLSRLLDYSVAADRDTAPRPEADTCAFSNEKQLSLKVIHFPLSYHSGLAIYYSRLIFSAHKL